MGNAGYFALKFILVQLAADLLFMDAPFTPPVTEIIRRFLLEFLVCLDDILQSPAHINPFSSILGDGRAFDNFLGNFFVSLYFETPIGFLIPRSAYSTSR